MLYLITHYLMKGVLEIPTMDLIHFVTLFDIYPPLTVLVIFFSLSEKKFNILSNSMDKQIVDLNKSTKKKSYTHV